MEVGVVGTGLTREVAGEEGDLVMRVMRMVKKMRRRRRRRKRRIPPT